MLLLSFDGFDFYFLLIFRTDEKCRILGTFVGKIRYTKPLSILINGKILVVIRLGILGWIYVELGKVI